MALYKVVTSCNLYVRMRLIKGRSTVLLQARLQDDVVVDVSLCCTGCCRSTGTSPHIVWI